MLLRNCNFPGIEEEDFDGLNNTYELLYSCNCENGEIVEEQRGTNKSSVKLDLSLTKKGLDTNKCFPYGGIKLNCLANCT